MSEGKAVLVWLVLSLALLTAWLTHVVTCLDRGDWFLLIAGAIAFPVGIIHGVGIWFGVW